MLYGVLDLARDPAGRLETALAVHAPEAVCLYGKPIHESVRRRAPYLAPLPPDSGFISFWNNNGRGLAWGIVIHSDQPLDNVRRHLRRFLTVQLPDGQRALFRFYDPRIFPAYLRSCNVSELSAWFAGIVAFVVEHDDEQTDTEFRFDGRKLVERQGIVASGRA